jgi:Family of unknown function (DUF5996)
MNMQKKWPDLQYDKLKDTIATVQLWTQIVGKIRLTKMPWLNHSWHVTLSVSTKGLTTGGIDYDNGIFELTFDFINHNLLITTSDGNSERVSLYPRTVASFYKELFEKLKALNIDVKIYAKPNEIDPAIPFEEDEVHKSYDKEQINLFWKALLKIEPVFNKFRAGFSGKCSPVHFFWGSFDLAVTRFSGREAPKHPGGAPNIPLKVMQESYSHEVSSAGFWPGNEAFPHPAFYSYAYPTPADFGTQKVLPIEAFYSTDMGEFFLKYDDVRKAAFPEKMLMEFLQSTYDAAADTGNWDKKSLEFNYF